MQMEQGQPFGLNHHFCQSHSVLHLWISLVSQLQSPKHSEKTRPILATDVPSTSTLAIFPSAMVCPSWELLCASLHYFGVVEVTENTYRQSPFYNHLQAKVLLNIMYLSSWFMDLFVHICQILDAYCGTSPSNRQQQFCQRKTFKLVSVLMTFEASQCFFNLKQIN